MRCRAASALARVGLCLAATVVLGCEPKREPPAHEVYGPARKPVQGPRIDAPWSDDFERPQLGDYYHATGGHYRIYRGALGTRGAYNHPLWLRRPLPRNAVIELDAWSNSRDGDIKVEVYGDGSSHATDRGQYTSTGYVLIMGGWNNARSILARGNEHGSQLVQRVLPAVEIGRRYHWKIVRAGDRMDWYVDDMETPFLSYRDPQPLAGAGHEYFGFNNWASDAWFDNLQIRPQ